MSNDSGVWKPHVTVAAICHVDDRFLLVKEQIDGRLVLNQPAGHLEPGESLQQAVVREMLEETAYEFTPEHLTGIYRYPVDESQTRCYLRFAFGGSTGIRHQRALDEGIVATEWMTIDEIDQVRHLHRTPMVMQCLLDYLQKPAYPLQLFSEHFL